MTTLTVWGQGASIQRFTVAGHAGFAQSGRDIVCAAVSILMTTSVNALESVAGIRPEVWQDQKAAEMALLLPTKMDGQAAHDAQIILRTVLQGFEDIAEGYPEHFKIIDGRTSSC